MWTLKDSQRNNRPCCWAVNNIQSSCYQTVKNLFSQLWKWSRSSNLWFSFDDGYNKVTMISSGIQYFLMLAWNGNGYNKYVINSLVVVVVVVVVVACSSSSSWELCNGCATWLPRGVWTLTGSARTTQPTHHHSKSGHLHHCHHHLYVHHGHTDGKGNNKQTESFCDLGNIF